MSRRTAAITGIGLLVVGPFAVERLLLYIEHLSPRHDPDAELLYLIAGLTIGGVGVYLLPIRRLFRHLMIAPYIAIMGVATWVSSLPIACAYFGDCL